MFFIFIAMYMLMQVLLFIIVTFLLYLILYVSHALFSILLMILDATFS